MGDFLAPVDIWDAALAWCGANLSGDSLRNKNIASKRYDQVRKAELARRTWTFATRRSVIRAIDVNTMRLQPALWSQLTTYFSGSVVTDQSGSYWISNIPNNLNNDPLLTNFWEPYFGPRSVSLYDSTIAYFSGELVYTTPGDGTARVYLSLLDGNADVPATATTYDATVTYFKNMVVTFSSISYMSLIDFNLNNTPSTAPALFNIATTYAAGNTVGGSDGVIYSSIGSGNVGHDPVSTIGFWTNTGVLNPWTTVFVGGVGSDKWLQIGGKEFPFGVGLTTLNNVPYPRGAGPSSQLNSKNVFLLPAGFLRPAPQSQKSGINSLGGPTGITYNDWLFEGHFLISTDGGPIPLRFVADITDVARMHTLFCEGLAARLAFTICDTVTQDKGQFEQVAKVYSNWRNEASTFDGIENGYTDSPEDELISCRN